MLKKIKLMLFQVDQFVIVLCRLYHQNISSQGAVVRVLITVPLLVSAIVPVGTQ